MSCSPEQLECTEDLDPTLTKTLRALQEPKATLGLVQFIAFLRSKVKPIRPKLHKRSAVKTNLRKYSFLRCERT